MLGNMLFYGEIYNAGKNFAQLALTNLTSLFSICFFIFSSLSNRTLNYLVYLSILRYESSTLILYKELSSTIFRSLSVSQ